MNSIDIAIICIVLLSAAISVFRGFVKEVLSLLSWIAAFWIAFTFSGELSAWLPRGVEEPLLRMSIAFVALFVATLIVGGLVNLLISSLVKRTGLSGTDRSLGVVFGAVRGALIVSILVMLAGLTTLPQDSEWRSSRLIVHFEQAAGWLHELLPRDMAAQIPSPS